MLNYNCLFPLQVRDTSRASLMRPSSLWKNPEGKSLEQVKKDFSDIILPEGLHNQVRSLAAMAANTKRHGAPYRHMLYYGKRRGGQGAGGGGGGGREAPGICCTMVRGRGGGPGRGARKEGPGICCTMVRGEGGEEEGGRGGRRGRWGGEVGGRGREGEGEGRMEGRGRKGPSKGRGGGASKRESNEGGGG